MTTSNALRDWLQPGEAFVSWHVNRAYDEVITVVGDADRLIGSHRVPLAPVEELLRWLEQQIAAMVAADMSAGPLPGSELPAVLGELAATVVPDALKQVAKDTDRYRRLISLPDGLLNGMPVELVIAAAVDDEAGMVFPDGVVVAPSASAFVHCRRKQAAEPPRSAAIVIGDADEDIQTEADRVAGMLSMPVTVVRSVEELTRGSERFGLLYVASHGFAPSSSTPGAVETDWTIALPGGNLTAEPFYTETIRLAPGAVVVLSACSLGRVLPGPAHELLGLINAIFYAGATSVLAARWEVMTEMASLVFAGTVEEHFTRGTALSAALRKRRRDAMADPAICAYVDGPQDLLFFEGPFVLFGGG